MNVSTSTAAHAAKPGAYLTEIAPKAAATATTGTAASTSGATPAKTDTVTISNAARAALAEAMETSAQTAKEARGGDRQAISALAKQSRNHPQQNAVPA